MLFRLQDKDLGKARERKLYCNTPTTDNAVQNFCLKAYSNLSLHFKQIQLPESSEVIWAGCPFNRRWSFRILAQYRLISVQDIFFPSIFSASKCHRPHLVQAIIVLSMSPFIVTLFFSDCRGCRRRKTGPLF